MPDSVMVAVEGSNGVRQNSVAHIRRLLSDTCAAGAPTPPCFQPRYPLILRIAIKYLVAELQVKA
jgi:hypothetical protein